MINPAFPMIPFNMGIPVGSVTAFAGYVGPPMSSPPSADNYNTATTPAGFGIGTVELQGWMVCNGRLLNCHAYQTLFLTIGFLYNQPGDKYKPGDANPGSDDPMATFRLPDYRGYFLRMVSGIGPWPTNESSPPGSNNPDPDVAKRYLLNSQTVFNSGIGSVQNDAMQTHQHGYYLAETPGTPDAEGVPLVVPPAAPAPTNSLTTEPTDQPNTQPGGVRISAETRAKNMYVYYLIKYA